MTRSHDPLALADATLWVRYTILSVAGVFLFASWLDGGWLATWMSLFILFCFVISFAITFVTVRSTHLVRWIPHNRAGEGGTAYQTVRIRNESPFSGLLSQLNDHFPAASRSQQVIVLGQALPSGSSVELPIDYTCDTRRGRYTIGPVRMMAFDCFGMFTISTIDEEYLDFYVYPSLTTLEGFAFAGEGSMHSFGMHMRRQIGVGADFAGVREFRDDDDYRHIHWLATAKRQRLMIREFDQIGSLEVTIFFDLSRESLCGLGKQTTTEYAIRIAGSIAQAALRESYSVQLLAEGDQSIFLPMGGGQQQFAEIMQALATVKPLGETPLYELVALHDESIARRSTAVMIFSKCDLDVGRYVESIQLLKARQVTVIAVIIEHTTFLPLDAMHDKAGATAALEQLKTLGASVYLVHLGDDLNQRLMQPVSWGIAHA